MFRKFALSLVVFAAAHALDARPADAAPISRGNPYRSFNISGVNYGSQRREMTHHPNNRSGRRTHGIFFRRR